MRRLTFIPLRDFEEMNRCFTRADVDIQTGGDVDFDQLGKKSGWGSLCFCCNVNKKMSYFWEI